MPDYSKSFIYQIWSPSNPDLVYIGSTTQSLAQRMGGHRRKYKQYLNGTYKSNVSSFQVLACGDADIELIKEVKCKCKAELHAIEGKYIRERKCVNKIIAGRTNKQYRIDNKQKINANQRQYYRDNKDKCDSQVMRYRNTHKDEYNKYQKSYRESHKEERKIIIQCECGSSVQKYNLPRHRRTKKHMNYISQHQQTPT